MKANILLLAAAASLVACASVAEPTPRADAAPIAQTSPADAKSLVREATDLMHRAVVSQNPADYRRADAAVCAALAADPTDPSAVAVRAWVLAGMHRFDEAAEWARRAAAMRPNEASNYGVLTDALVELGDYDAAVDAAQTMIDLRPAEPSYARVAYLRSLHGDREGAIELMRMALSASPDASGRAWCLVHLATETQIAGDAASAESYCREALATLPGWRLARLGLARAQAGRGDASAAESTLRGLLAENGEDADAHAELGELLLARGCDEATAHLDVAEKLERAELAAGGNEGHHLVALLVARGDRPDEALRWAREEASHRRDVFTCDRLALAAAAAGRTDEALAASRDALRTGADDPGLLAHAGIVAASAGDPARARALLDEALAREEALRPLDRVRARDVRRAIAD